MKHQVSTRGQDKVIPESESPKPLQLEVRKHLSLSTIILIGLIYTMVVVKLTMIINEEPTNSNIAIDEDKIVAALQSKLDQTMAIKNSLPPDVISKGEFKRLKSELMEEVSRINNKYIELVQKEKEKSEIIIKDFVINGPAKVSDGSGSKVLPYSIKNKEMLWAQYHQKRKRLEEQIEADRLEALKALNMNSVAGQDAFKEFQDKSELLLKELEAEHYERLRIFEKQQYLIVDKK